jgi:hypothetical protein
VYKKTSSSFGTHVPAKNKIHKLSKNSVNVLLALRTFEVEYAVCSSQCVVEHSGMNEDSNIKIGIESVTFCRR